MGVNTSGLDAKRGDLLMINPADLLVNHEENSRFIPVSESEIERLAQSIKDETQLQPVGIAKSNDGSWKLVYGYGRYRAIMSLNQGKTPDDADFIRLKAIIVRGNDTDFLVKNLMENDCRTPPNHMDWAKTIALLQDRAGMTQAQIAEKFRKTPGWVYQHQELLKLIRPIQLKVASGEIGLMEGLNLSKLSPEKQRETVGAIEEVVEEVKTETANATADGNAESATPANEDKATKKLDRKAKAAIKNVVQQATGKLPTVALNIPKKANPYSRNTGDLKEMFSMISEGGNSKEMCLIAEIILQAIEGKIHEDLQVIRMLEAVVDSGAKTISQAAKKAGA